MNTIATSRGRGISDVAERQMRTWALQLQSQQRLAEERAATPLPKLVHSYLVVSREAGVDARELAQAVASKCGWKMLDRELLDYMAEHDHLSRLALDFVDWHFYQILAQLDCDRVPHGRRIDLSQHAKRTR